MKITIAGGDQRMNTVAEKFGELGYVCERIGFDESNVENALKNTSAVIFPIPYCKGNNLNAPLSNSDISLEKIFSLVGKDTLLLGGGLPETEENRIDYAKNEGFLLQNARITAEGAISIAMNGLNTTLCGSNAVILGYGRIGGCLTDMLRSLGVHVSVMARRSISRLQAEMSGARSAGFEDIEALFSEADVIFNTVPTPIADEKVISALNPKALFIDLASLPGGLTKVAEEFLGERYIRALGLPGKYAPKTAGRVIFETVFEILRERGALV